MRIRSVRFIGYFDGRDGWKEVIVIDEFVPRFVVWADRLRRFFDSHFFILVVECGFEGAKFVEEAGG